VLELNMNNDDHNIRASGTYAKYEGKEYFSWPLNDRVRLFSDDDPLPPGFELSRYDWVRGEMWVPLSEVEHLVAVLTTCLWRGHPFEVGIIVEESAHVVYLGKDFDAVGGLPGLSRPDKFEVKGSVPVSEVTDVEVRVDVVPPRSMECAGMPLETRQQALEFLARLQPDVTFNVYPFESGWICMEDISSEERLGLGLGMASLILDKQTGVATVQSGLPMDLVAQQYAEAKRMGQQPQGRQIYPYQWAIKLHRIRENDQAIVYQMSAVSLAEPREPMQDHLLTIEKSTLATDPTDWLSGVAMSYAEWVRRQNHGAWPLTAATRV
jgi:hypothetical protein